MCRTKASARRGDVFASTPSEHDEPRGLVQQWDAALHIEVVEEIAAGALESSRQQLRWEGTLHPAWPQGAVATQWREVLSQALAMDWSVSGLAT